MAVITYLLSNTPGCIGVSVSGDEYRLDFADSDSRLATSSEVLVASRLFVEDQIKKFRDNLRSAGCPVGIFRFHSDDTSRIQQLALVLLGANIPPGLLWKTMSGAFATMTPTLAQQIFISQVQRDSQLFSVAEQHIGQIKLSENPLEYNYNANWPE